MQLIFKVARFASDSETEIVSEDEKVSDPTVTLSSELRGVGSPTL
uniref:Uncharacterized protein n=1 Tax=Coccidioides posadasii RMSCC 3488 TaxID=454284 RepID=A0A0J6FJ30_COCPO|nr:hypothetical protein CPAG_06625 [Coccidioides posadasii RMSCC 3488]